MRHPTQHLRQTDRPASTLLVRLTRLALVIIAVPAVLLGAVTAAAFACVIAPLALVVAIARHAIRALTGPGGNAPRLIA